MSLAQAPLPDRGASPLMSNNPFRNRIASSTPRPVSTNPFLDNAEIPKQQSTATIKAVPSDSRQDAADIFGSLSISGRPPSPSKHHLRANGASRRLENDPPRPATRGHMGHRSTLSDEERRKQSAAGQPPKLDIFADPPVGKSRAPEPRQTRRNSESSVMDRPRPLLDEEEKKRRERKYRESKKMGTSKSKPSRRLDVIDKLDVTSIYGTGLFHHDGPFDACNPHRNRRRHKLAPMHAFPVDSENMKIGGSGPLNSKIDYNKFHGYGQEAHIDYNEARQGQTLADDDAAALGRPLPDRSISFNATSRVDPVHGDETAGLGTSTFLEGAPASRAAIERRDSEFDRQQTGPGLSRKKSLAQKIRAVRPVGRNTGTDADATPTSPLATGKSESAVNPFFKDYDKEYDRKGAQIASVEESDNGSKTHTRTPSSPRPVGTLERSITADGTDPQARDAKSTGFLGRMKSLKKPRARSERRDAS